MIFAAVIYLVLLALLFGTIFTYSKFTTEDNLWSHPTCLRRVGKRSVISKEGYITHYTIFRLPWVLCRNYKYDYKHIHRMGGCPYCYYDYDPRAEVESTHGWRTFG
jgi:hypothetical protein